MNESVEIMEQETVLDDAALSPVQDEAPIESLDDLVATQPDPQPQQQPPKKEPGWLKQRLAHATEKAVRETEERLRAEFAAKMAPLYESIYDRQADDLVASGEFKTKERALEYVKLKHGEVDTPKPQQQPQQQQQASPEGDPNIKVRANWLASQADKIKARHGVDVVQAIKDSPDMRQKVMSGEWDFYDVVDALAGDRRMPSPVRTPNGANIGKVTIENMSDAQFERLQNNLAGGKVYDAR